MAKKVTSKTVTPVKVTVETVNVEGVRTFKFTTTRIDPKTGREQYRCGDCGKWLFSDLAIERGEGAYCNHLRDAEGWTDDALLKWRKEHTIPEVPEGWIKVAVLDAKCKKASVPISKMLAMMGWDRGLAEPVDPRFAPKYVGNARYVDGFCGTKEGLKMIAACTRKKPTVKYADAKTVKEDKQDAETVATEDAIADALAEMVA